MWAQLGDADMCMHCYTTMRAAGAHPGESGFAALLRVFRERGDEATCAQLLEDMGSVTFDRMLFKRKSTDASADAVELGLENFKLLLRYHAELAEEDVCARVVEEMRKREVAEDEETRNILASITKVKEEQETISLQPTRRHTKFSRHLRTPRAIIPTTHPTTTPIPEINTPNPPTSNADSTPLPPTSTPQPTSRSIYEAELEKWTQIKQKGEIPTYEFIHSLLRSASREGDGDTCEELLTAMDVYSIKHTAEAYACGIEARKVDFVRCEELFVAMRTQEIRPTLPAYNNMLWVFCAQRRNEEAFALFEEMKDVADTISYNTLMRVYAGDGNLQSVMLLSAQMKERGVAHDAATYTIIVELLGRFGARGMVVVDAVVREIEANNIQPDVVLYDTLMDVYGGMGNWEQCERVWHEMKGKQVLGEASCARFLQKHCYKDPSIYVKWKKEFSNFLPP
jgi:pentatricopeptide repeat protein